MKRTFNLLVLVALLVLTFGTQGVTPAKAVSYTLFGVNPFTNNNSTIPNNYGLFYLDRTTGAIMDGKVITLAGYTVNGANGLAVDPTTDTVYVIMKVASVSGRVLGTIDLDTGAAIWVGNLGDNFSSIAFRSDGQLFGTTGDGATVPETLYLIDKSNGSKTLAATLGNGGDGEVIAYNPNDNKFYHWSGNGTVFFESIAANSPYTVTPISSGSYTNEVFGAVWDPTQNVFLVHAINSAMSSWDTAGNQTNLQAGTVADVRGMVIVESVRLFGTTGSGGGGSTLVELNPTTGALVSTIGPVGYAVNGLDYDPVSGNLYATTSTNDANFPSGLITIDMNTGAGTQVVSLGSPEGCLPTNIRANAGGTLFAWSECEDDLVVINPATGDTFYVGESGIDSLAYGMSFDANNVLYFINGDGYIYTVNKYSGAATDTGNSISTYAHHGDFHPDTGRYWGISVPWSNPKTINVVNVSTGAVDANLSTVNNLHTLTFVPGNQPAVDVVKPVLNLTNPIIQYQSNAYGAYADYSGGTATDETSPANPAVQCYPRQGDFLTFGNTAASCFALDNQGNAAFGNTIITVLPASNSTFTSLGAYDGTIFETTETSGVGGAPNISGGFLDAGDMVLDRQVKSLMHFDTSSLPDNAVVTGVTLQLKRYQIVGTNPFDILDDLSVDIASPYFGPEMAFRQGDFQATASEANVGTFNPNPLAGNWYEAVLGSGANSSLNLTGPTQFRIQFTTDDNDNLKNDFIRFFSGNSPIAGYRPVLVVYYYIP